MQVNSFQENLNNQLFNTKNSFYVASKGKIVKFTNEDEGLCEVELNNKLLINNQIAKNIITAKIFDCNSINTYKVNDNVIVLFTDYNVNNQGVIDLRMQQKHTAQNGIIISKADDFNKDNNKNVIIQAREGEEITINGEENLKATIKKDIILNLQGKVSLKNNDADLYTEFSNINQNFSQFKTSMNTLLTTDLTTGMAGGQFPVVFSTLATTATQIQTQLTNINTALQNIQKLLKNGNS